MADSVLVFVLGNLVTLVIVGVLYLSHQIFAPYLGACIYGLLLSEALQRPKQWLFTKVQRISEACMIPTQLRLGHGFAAFVVLFGIVGIGITVLIHFAMLGFQDFLALLHAGRGLLTDNVNPTTLQAWGINATTIQKGLQDLGAPEMLNHAMTYLNQTVIEFEAEYNTTPWWPVVGEFVDKMQECFNWENFTQSDSSLDGDDWFTKLPQINSTRVMEVWDHVRQLQLWRLGHLWQSLQIQTGEVLKAMFKFGWVAANALGAVGLGIGSFASSIINLIFFVSVAFALLCSETSYTHELIGGLFPGQEEQLQHILEGVFVYPVALYFGRLFYTLVVGGLILQLHFPFLLAILTFVVSMVPFLHPYPIIACLPWLVYLIIAGFQDLDSFHAMTGLGEAWGLLANLRNAVLLLLFQYFGIGYVESFEAARAFHLPPWITGLSVVCGFVNFGWQAFFLCPLLISLVSLGWYQIKGEVQESKVKENDDFLQKLTVTELKERCRKAGLNVTGVKADLVARLKALPDEHLRQGDVSPDSPGAAFGPVATDGPSSSGVRRLGGAIRSLALGDQPRIDQGGRSRSATTL